MKGLLVQKLHFSMVSEIYAAGETWPISSSNMQPMQSPTHQPMQSPTHQPMQSPTHQPMQSPTHQPMQSPTHQPMQSPTHQPMQSPTHQPMQSPTPFYSFNQCSPDFYLHPTRKSIFASFSSVVPSSQGSLVTDTFPLLSFSLFRQSKNIIIFTFLFSVFQAL